MRIVTPAVISFADELVLFCGKLAAHSSYYLSAYWERAYTTLNSRAVKTSYCAEQLVAYMF